MVRVEPERLRAVRDQLHQHGRHTNQHPNRPLMMKEAVNQEQRNGQQEHPGQAQARPQAKNYKSIFTQPVAQFKQANRLQSYAWGGVAVVALLAFGLSRVVSGRLGGKKEE